MHEYDNNNRPINIFGFFQPSQMETQNRTNPIFVLTSIIKHDLAERSQSRPMANPVICKYNTIK